MPKAIPPCPDLDKLQHGPSGETRTYRIELITPLFGGGVEAGENDPTMPIRGTAIRGQLQFWWRATQGAACATVEELRERHRQVWGATECASPIKVIAEQVSVEEPQPCAVYEYEPPRGERRGRYQLKWLAPFATVTEQRWGRKHDPKDVVYALFPFQGKASKRPDQPPEKNPATYIASGSFVLRVGYPKHLEDDVNIAVWAWVNFGGLGARTRRGCGSLYCPELAPRNLKNVPDWFRDGAAASHGVRRDWPTLGGRLLHRSTTSTTFDAWNDVIGHIRLFRQGRGIGRNPGDSENRPGRSRFPEPETIRRIMDTGSEKHEPWNWMPDGFARAEFGLPIVFHFKDEKAGEPPQTCLYPFVDEETKDRMASPLVLKPLALQDRSAVSVILPLLAPEVTVVELQDEDKKCRTPRRAVPVRDPAFATYPQSPLQGRSATGSALEAFLAFVKEAPRSFVEVSR